ncbi:hypothetical protein DFJ68_2205 [Terracoccus luteus]|uniref:Uncharacterized protein n=1 Tax=Terracoccus luteus TaxID=53356 RepID=A0A495Y1G9_9MICO|nr:hypothetical protein DFJ68_2205 [Terracoccus luteus]
MSRTYRRRSNYDDPFAPRYAPYSDRAFLRRRYAHVADATLMRSRYAHTMAPHNTETTRQSKAI